MQHLHIMDIEKITYIRKYITDEGKIAKPQLTQMENESKEMARKDLLAFEELTT